MHRHGKSKLRCLAQPRTPLSCLTGFLLKKTIIWTTIKYYPLTPYCKGIFRSNFAISTQDMKQLNIQKHGFMQICQSIPYCILKFIFLTCTLSLKNIYFVKYQKAENQDVLNCPFKKNLKEEEKNQALFCTLHVQNTIYRSHYSALWDFLESW